MDKKIENIVKHAERSEKTTEAYLVQRVKELGGVCLKYSNPNMVGYPDRVALLPAGICLWVELKSKGQKPNRVQQLRFRQMAQIGHAVNVIDSKESVDLMLENILNL
jgi:hypothetical protein